VIFLSPPAHFAGDPERLSALRNVCRCTSLPAGARMCMLAHEYITAPFTVRRQPKVYGQGTEKRPLGSPGFFPGQAAAVISEGVF